VTKEAPTLVTFLLDKSGSMASCRDSTIEAFNGFVGTLRDAKTPISFTFIQFDTTGIDKVYFEKPIKDVPDLNANTYVPNGGTPLIEAATKTIRALEKAIAAKTEKPKVVFCIQTDGEENSSAAEFTWDALKALIEAKTKEGWQFNFMGAGIDAYNQAGQMGIAAMATMSYDHTSKAATRAAFSAHAQNTSAYAAGARASTHYTMEQRAASGDKFSGRASGLPSPLAPLVPRKTVIDPHSIDLGGTSKSDLDLTQ